MAWTAPRTWVTGETVTAAHMNTDVRDNMLETAAATAAAAGDIVFADAANSMGSRLAHPGQSRYIVSDGSSGYVARRPEQDTNWSTGTSQSISSTSYVSQGNLANDGHNESLPVVTVTTGTRAVVMVGCSNVFNDTAGASVFLSYSISGATTLAAADSRSGAHESGNANDRGNIGVSRLEILTAGSNTFQVEAKVTVGGNGTIVFPRILVIPL